MIARRYAKALLELGIHDKQFERYGREVSAMAKLFSDSSELRHALTNPVFQISQRNAVVETLGTKAEMARPVINFLKLLVERERIAELPHIALVLADMVDLRARRVRASVSTARPLAAEAKSALERAIQVRTGKQVQLDVKTDPEQLGGVVVKIGDLIFDGSVRGQLERIKKQLES
jgi:F-type H+-transporting ATPase subunit delta